MVTNASKTPDSETEGAVRHSPEFYERLAGEAIETDIPVRAFATKRGLTPGQYNTLNRHVAKLRKSMNVGARLEEEREDFPGRLMESLLKRSRSDLGVLEKLADKTDLSPQESKQLDEILTRLEKIKRLMAKNELTAPKAKRRRSSKY